MKPCKENMFVGFHTRIGDKNVVPSLIKLIDKLAGKGINALILEFNPGYSYECFPEYSNGTFDKTDAAAIKTACDKNNIEVIPLFQCLSHQCANMGGEAWPLLKAHPEFCEVKEYIDGGEWPDIYCHSWCASNDDIYKYIFPMMDEIIDVFNAKTLHIGLDEVFEIGEDCCDLCRGKDKAELFAHTVKIIKEHLDSKNVKTMMWGDRLLDAEKLGYQMWEADKFGMHPAFNMTDKITRDITITDWHYDLHSDGYPSVGQFIEGGFNTIITFGADQVQAKHFYKFALEYIYLAKKFKWAGKFGGVLFTQWTPLTPKIAYDIMTGLSSGGSPIEPEFCPTNVGKTICEMMKKL